MYETASPDVKPVHLQADLTANGLRQILRRVYDVSTFDAEVAYSTLRDLEADELFDLYVFSRKTDFPRLQVAVVKSLALYLPALQPSDPDSKEIRLLKRWIAVACDEDDETLMEGVLRAMETTRSLEPFGIWTLLEMVKPEWELEILRALLQGGDSVKSKAKGSAKFIWTTRRLQMVDSIADIKFRPNTRKRKSEWGLRLLAPCTELTRRAPCRR